jgi:hypothetical protein
MAKGKKSSGTHYTSKGERPNVNRGLLKATKLARTGTAKMANVMAAWAAGKNPWVTVVNPNKAETNKPFIRVRANDIWGLSKENYFRMKAA